MKKQQTKQNPDPKGSGVEKRKTSIKEWIILVFVFGIIVFVIPNYIVQRTYVKGESMENALHSGEYIMREKVSNYFSDPKRFDIVVFQCEILEEDCIKRVIGLPGEKVQIVGTDIYINDVLLEEDYGKSPIEDSGIASEPIYLEEAEFFVLGDNRNESIDSRAEGIGPVKKTQMDGRAMLRIWPLNKVKIIN